MRNSELRSAGGGLIGAQKPNGATICPKHEAQSHTQGPWTAVDCTRHDDTRIRTQLVHGGRGALWIEHDNTEEGYANAAIATAAPQLLEACTAREAAVSGADQAEAEADVLIRAAIAKATA